MWRIHEVFEEFNFHRSGVTMSEERVCVYRVGGVRVCTSNWHLCEKSCSRTREACISCMCAYVHVHTYIIRQPDLYFGKEKSAQKSWMTCIHACMHTYMHTRT